jgi:sortase A
MYLSAKGELARVLIRKAWEVSLRSGKPKAPWPWADTHPVARMRIPRIGYDEIVLEGATPRTLAFGPARMSSGAEIGAAGNLLLAGHRTSWFKPLKEVAAGDRIEIEWFDAKKHKLRRRLYTVAATNVVDPKEVGLLAETTSDALILVTCYPFGSSPTSPWRYVVQAKPVA